MTRTRAEINAIKVKFFDYMTAEPSITNAELGRRCGIRLPTVAKYRKQFNKMVENAQLEVARKVEEQTRDGGVIWHLIKKYLRIRS